MSLRLLPVLLLALASLARATDLDDAVALYKEKKYPEARVALEKITAAEPQNASAAYHLGLTLLRRNAPKSLDEAVPWLEKAATLEPKNTLYLFDCGGAMLQLARKNTSLSAASKARELLEKAVVLKPDYTDAREALYQYYSQAPFFAGGSNAKAKVHLEAIRQYDPDRATVLTIIAKANAKDFAAAFKICDEVLAKDPDNYTAHYQYGRTAAVSDLNLANGLVHLQKCLTLTPPNASSPPHTHVWNRIGNLHEKLKHPAEARTAYETALKLDPGNKQASDALAKLK